MLRCTHRLRLPICALACGLALLMMGASVEGSAPRPDLTVSFLQVPKPRVVGEPARIIAEVRNIGTAAAGPFVLVVEVDGQRVGSKQIDGLAVRKSTRTEFEYQSPTVGLRLVRAVVQAASEDANADNDDREQVLTWMRPLAERGRADFVVGRLSFNHGGYFDVGKSPVAHVRLWVSFAVANVGAASKRPVDVVVMLDGVREYRTKIEKLGSGDSDQFETFLSGPIAGKHTLEVVVDPDERYLEFDETNNVVRETATWRRLTRKEYDELRALAKRKLDARIRQRDQP